MPGSKREKRKPVLGEDGWTVVGAGGSRSQDAAPEGLLRARPSGIVAGLTVEKLACELEAMEKKWKTSACARGLHRLLGLRDWQLQQAVCIGIGSFSRDWDHRYRSLWQLVLFRAVCRLVQHPDQPPLALHAQEPAFTALDLSFLAHLGILVTAAAIESHIAPTCFVFAPFVDWHLLLPVFLKDKDPDLYIGNEILASYAQFANSPDKKAALPECNQLGKRFSESRERRRVPDFEEHGSALEGLMIYWREDEDD